MSRLAAFMLGFVGVSLIMLALVVLGGCAAPRPGIYSQISIIDVPIPEASKE